MRFVFVRCKEKVRALELGVDVRMLQVGAHRLLVKRGTDEIMNMFVKDIPRSLKCNSQDEGGILTVASEIISNNSYGEGRTWLLDH